MRSRSRLAEWTPCVALTLLFVMACGPVNRSTGADPYGGHGGPSACPTVEVRNRTWFDVVVYQTQPRERLGDVTAQGTKHLEMCNARGAPALLIVDPIGSRLEWSVRGSGMSTFGAGDSWVLQVSKVSANQYLRPRDAAGFGGPLVDFYALEVERVEVPHSMWLGIYRDVAMCLGLWGEVPRAPDIEWYVAGYLLDTDEGYRAYGAVEFEGDTPARLFLDREYAFHATVISHEIVHVLEGLREPEGSRCVMPVPGPLPVRPITPEVMEMIGGR